MPDPEESLTKLESLITLFGHETDWGHPDIRGLLIMSLVGVVCCGDDDVLKAPHPRHPVGIPEEIELDAAEALREFPLWIRGTAKVHAASPHSAAARFLFVIFLLLPRLQEFHCLASAFKRCTPPDGESATSSIGGKQLRTACEDAVSRVDGIDDNGRTVWRNIAGRVAVAISKTPCDPYAMGEDTACSHAELTAPLEPMPRGGRSVEVRGSLLGHHASPGSCAVLRLCPVDASVGEEDMSMPLLPSPPPQRHRGWRSRDTPFGGTVEPQRVLTFNLGSGSGAHRLWCECHDGQRHDLGVVTYRPPSICRIFPGYTAVGDEAWTGMALIGEVFRNANPNPDLSPSPRPKPRSDGRTFPSRHQARRGCHPRRTGPSRSKRPRYLRRTGLSLGYPPSCVV